MLTWNVRRKLRRLSPAAAALLLPLPLLGGGQPPTRVPPGTPVTITVTPATPAPPTVTITLKDRHGHVTPARGGCTHTGGGNIDVAQPAPDTLVVTMTGVTVATGGPHGSTAALNFDLDQCFEVVFEKPEVKAAKVTLEGRVIGLLRSHCKGGAASESGGCATVMGGPVAPTTVCVPEHAVAGGENLSVNDHAGPVSSPISAGRYTLHQAWVVAATHPRSLLGKAASAEFAPDPALDPLWISYREPWHGAVKKDFGFQIILKVADDTEAQKEAEKVNGKREATPPPRDKGAGKLDPMLDKSGALPSPARGAGSAYAPTLLPR